MRKKRKIEKPIKLCTLDTETRGLFGEVFRIGFFDGSKYTVSNTWAPIKQHLDELTPDYDVHVYIHNLDFDLAKLGKELLPDVDLENSIFINNNVAVFTSGRVVLHDSLKLLPSSLEKICKDFHLEESGKVDLSDHLKQSGYAIYKKGSFDKDASLENYFMTVDPSEPMLNHYLEYDCRSLHTVIKTVKDISGLCWEDFVSCPTTASLSMKVYKEQFREDYDTACSGIWRGEWGQFCESFVRQGYYGGRVEVFLPHLENGYHYDVNSLYPYVMKVNEFPVGYYKLFEGKKAEYCYRYWKQSGTGAGMMWAKIYVPEHLNIPPLPYRDKKMKKLIFPVGHLDGVWTFHEIDNALRYGCRIDHIEQVLFWEKTAPIFKDYVETYEVIKNTSEGAKRQFAKLLQNSLYGKFGMQRKRRTLVGMHHEEKLKKEGKLYIKYTHPILQEPFLLTENEIHAHYIQPQIAAYVTSFARILLYNSIQVQAAKGPVAYCDTDSIACGSEMEPDMVHKNEYGKWDLEGKIESAIFIQPKMYYEKHIGGKETIKAKGIPKKILNEFSGEFYKEILSDIHSGKERIYLYGNYDEEQIKPKFEGEQKTRKKFVSMLKAGEHFDTELYIRKSLHLRTKQKRHMNYSNNSSAPHVVNDY